jgi:hypothetical protein
MNETLTKPFRAPRAAKERAIPLGKESEEPTELGLVWGRVVVKETQAVEVDQTEKDRSGSQCTTAKVNDPTHESSKVQSPCLSEFEDFLDQCDARRKWEAEQREALPLLTSRQRMDAFWESILQNEKRRLAEDTLAPMINVEDICLNEFSDDDDVPIVDTLPQKTKNLSLLANAASKKRVKKPTKTLWSYETVAEPAGVVSKYWDSPASSVRSTKRIAKQKLSDFKSTSFVCTTFHFICLFFICRCVHYYPHVFQ